ncbi:MAG TPA: phosphoribosylformylglycinamidine synthase [Patescibacteria group bacterium]|nr:phosphoribosylformylglycinamidine synthase [Patescibacteria group bacterium]
MGKTVRRLFVEKKEEFAVEAAGIFRDLKDNLGIRGLTGVRVIHRYDVSGIDDQDWERARDIVFSEPPVDIIYEENLPLASGQRVFAIEYLPGQYDQRADSAAQCVQVLTQQERPDILTARVLILAGDIEDADFSRIRDYCINPVEAREAALVKPATLEMVVERPADVLEVKDFISFDEEKLQSLMTDMGLAMSAADLAFCQQYFRDTERRDPTVTEIRAIDTYWSDHCRHTTFFTAIDAVEIEAGTYNEPVAAAHREYCEARQAYYGEQAAERDICLMDIATLAMKELRREGRLPDLDESEEINACSIMVAAAVTDHAGKTGKEEWLVMFKNETHNHPTEIEPFGGAATCLGGAIRDPLSGRSYVYQAMRVTGSGDPRTRVENTLAGKLPQRKITTGAAAGYSSYGNQIGLATGQVAEVYDEDFVAKRMEIGAVMAAAPRENVVRQAPDPGDIIILLGGRTGRDGCGGATGSSKEHTEESLLTCGAEVQKGNPPTERKIQRLFRDPAVSRLIKRCNDFGAGGVSVAIGELADGLEINLDAVPKKYEGLDGTELAISESQERMAVVVAPQNVARFIEQATRENLEATVVASVQAEPRLVMRWRGKTIVNVSREFLNTNGVRQHARVLVTAPATTGYFQQQFESETTDAAQAWKDNLSQLNVCSQKGLVERFDSSIGAGTVLMPFGGRHQITPVDGMVAKLPVLTGDTVTGTVMTYGYNAQLAKWSPFHGALYAVVEAAAKTVALGGSYRKIRLTLQEYFEKLGNDEQKWGKPFSALLGAYYAQKRLGLPAIGGKDSMSGTFKDLNVPPTLVAFGVSVVDVRRVISPEFKQAGSRVVYVPAGRDEQGMPDFTRLTTAFDTVERLMAGGQVLAAAPVKIGGVAAAISKMSFGNRLGAILNGAAVDWFAPDVGGLVLEMPAELPEDQLAKLFGNVAYQPLGVTQCAPILVVDGIKMSLEGLQTAWEMPLEKIFPTGRPEAGATTLAVIPEAWQATTASGKGAVRHSRQTVARPKVFIPVFPGTNCEYDTARAFEQAGAEARVMVVRNLTAAQIEESVQEIARRISESQIVMLPGGFSAGDEPDGSGKFIAALLRNPRIKEAITQLLEQRDGLMLGICNGFQALIKLGLVPYGEIRDMHQESPTLTFNQIGRHISCMAHCRAVSRTSPWLAQLDDDEIYRVPVSHGEGRFVARPEEIDRLFASGQVAFQYVDLAGQPTYDIRYNPNGAMAAIEGITSPDGRVLGKMGHSERIGAAVARNVPGKQDQRLFAAGVEYFR